MTRDERRAQHTAHLFRQVVAMAHLQCVNLPLQQATQLRVGFGQLTIQPVSRENQRIFLGVKAQRRAEETSKGRDVAGLAVGKTHLRGFPVGSA